MLRHACAVSVLAVLVLIAGCSSESGRILGPAMNGGSSLPHALGTASALLGPDGGTITCGSTQLVVPAGALSDTVTVTMVAGQDGSSPYCTLSPAGLSLGSQATITIPRPLKAGADDVYHVFGTDPATGIQNDLGGTASGGFTIAQVGQFQRLDEELIQ